MNTKYQPGIPTLDDFKTEVAECVAGTRSAVVCTKARAEQMGVAWAELLSVCNAQGLRIDRQARGYVAYRKSVPSPAVYGRNGYK